MLKENLLDDGGDGLDLNCGTLVSESTALPTAAPQMLPKLFF